MVFRAALSLTVITFGVDSTGFSIVFTSGLFVITESPLIVMTESPFFTIIVSLLLFLVTVAWDAGWTGTVFLLQLYRKKIKHETGNKRTNFFMSGWSVNNFTKIC